MSSANCRTFSHAPLLASLLAILLSCAAAGAQEQAMPGAAPQPQGDMPAGYVPPLLQKARDGARIDDRTGDYLPRDVELIDSSGKRVRLGDYFDGKRPVIVQLAYYRCPKLCGEVTKGMVSSMRELAQQLRLSDDYQILTISFDSREPATLALSNKEAVIDVLGRDVSPEAVRNGWSFFVAEDSQLKRLTDAMGYRFLWLGEVEQYSHPAAIMICTPDGMISRYLYGVSYDTQTMRLSLIDASQGSITPSLKDQFILSCFDYDPEIGRYTPVAIKLMRIAGAVTVLMLAALIGFMVMAERRGMFMRHKYRGTAADEADDDGGDPPPAPPRTAFS